MMTTILFLSLLDNKCVKVHFCLNSEHAYLQQQKKPLLQNDANYIRDC